jgi:hypothetical protein
MAVAMDMQHLTPDKCGTGLKASVKWKREEMTLVPMGSSLRLNFFKQLRPNRPVISLSC